MGRSADAEIATSLHSCVEDTEQTEQRAHLVGSSHSARLVRIRKIDPAAAHDSDDAQSRPTVSSGNS
eukprot:6200480-Pleurochrysis_carterae.AAC.2